MTSANALTTIAPADYDAIEEAVMETARGRWFLAEYARRNRNSDTTLLLDAIGRIEQTLTGERMSQDLDKLRFDLMEMSRSIARMKSEIATLRPTGAGVTHLEEATEALDSVVRTTERATSDILEAAEAIQEAAWNLRECDGDPALCDILDKRATDIYTACSFQDLTAQRIGKIVFVLRYLEGRINAMIDIVGSVDVAQDEQSHSARHPEDDPLAGFDVRLTQSDIDEVIVEEPLDEPALHLSLMPEPGPLHDGDIAFAGDEPLGSDMPAAEMPAAELPATAMDRALALRDEEADHAARQAQEDAGLFATQEEAPVELLPYKRQSLPGDAFVDIDALEPLEKLRRFT